ncbi:MAG: GHKL domain-containing protein, partial [Bacteroidia bacterium]|nr:GHKL domain-containing protein [Bacteroidia bacterium]
AYPISTEYNISSDSINIAPMLLIPFIENALKHSNIDDLKNSFINIKLNADDNEIHFEVKNSLPKTAHIKDEVGGIGLENVKKRLAILYPKKHELEISETDSTFKLNLQLKLT